MTQLTENRTIEEHVILAAVCTGSEADTAASLHELAQLAVTAGAVVEGQLFQNRSAPDPATYFGSGKLDEIRELIESTGANGLICDDELTPAQMRNLQKEIPCKIMDRTLLILDIFAARANTSEGRIQVELAQLQHALPMLAGLGKSMSRLGGGIGTRGPGEKKLETDRRRIRERISRLKADLTKVRAHRSLLRSGRAHRSVPVAAIVGYTNAGKSTLLNTLTGADILAEDKLFATLDPVTRELDLEDGLKLQLTDTVGFIDKLPHHLIDAFRSTLEEARYADVIVHVVDASSPRAPVHMHVVYETLRQLQVTDKPVITLFNKTDLLPAGPDGERHLRDHAADASLMVSAVTGEGLPLFLRELKEILTRDQILIERRYPYAQAGRLALIRESGVLLEEEYLEDSIRIRAYVPAHIYGKL